jgi:hypothetical protein
MSDHTKADDFGNLPTLLMVFGSISLLSRLLTQLVGIPLGAIVTTSLLAVMLARGMRLRYRWRRPAFVLFFPVALWLLWSGGDHGGFFFDHGGVFDLFFMMAGVLLYVYGVIRLVAAGSRATVASSPDGPDTLGALASISVMVVATFLFAWWWTNSSSAFHLLASGDMQGIGVCVAFLFAAVVVGGLALAIWWRPKWQLIAGGVVPATGIALLIHAVYYSLVTGMVHISEATGSRPRIPGGVSTTAIIVGRFLFALLAVGIGLAPTSGGTAC